MDANKKAYLARAIELYLDHSYGDPDPIEENTITVAGKELTFKDCEDGPDTVSVCVHVPEEEDLVIAKTVTDHKDAARYEKNKAELLAQVLEHYKNNP